MAMHGSNICWRERRSPWPGADALRRQRICRHRCRDHRRRADAAKAPTCRRRASRTRPGRPAPAATLRPSNAAKPSRRTRGRPRSPFGAGNRRHQVQHRIGPRDTAIVDKLREQLAAGKFDRVLGGKKERATVEAFYSSRDFAPLWIADGAMNDRAKAAAAYLAGVDADGLEPSEYPMPQIRPAWSRMRWPKPRSSSPTRC